MGRGSVTSCIRTGIRVRISKSTYIPPSVRPLISKNAFFSSTHNRSTTAGINHELDNLPRFVRCDYPTLTRVIYRFTRWFYFCSSCTSHPVLLMRFIRTWTRYPPRVLPFFFFFRLCRVHRNPGKLGLLSPASRCLNSNSLRSTPPSQFVRFGMNPTLPRYLKPRPTSSIEYLQQLPHTITIISPLLDPSQYFRGSVRIFFFFFSSQEYGSLIILPRLINVILRWLFP
jgi:hypothetical protein